MPITPGLEITSSDDCKKLIVRDVTTFTDTSRPEDVTCRNLSVIDPCGRELAPAAKPRIDCLSIAPLLMAEWELSGVAGLTGARQLIVNGASALVADTPGATATLLASALNTALGATYPDLVFSGSGTVLSATFRTSIPGALTTYQAGPAESTLSPAYSMPGTATGTGQLVLILCGKRYEVALLATSWVQPSVSLDVSTAIRLTQERVMTQLCGLLQADATDLECGCGITIACDCQSSCQLRIQGPNGVQALDYSFTSTDDGLVVTSTSQEAECNWPYAAYYQFPAQATTGQSYVSILRGNLEYSLSLTVVATTPATRAQELANALAALGLGAWSVDAVAGAVVILDTVAWSALEYSSGTIEPVVTPAPVLELGLDSSCDGVYHASLSVDSDAGETGQVFVPLAGAAASLSFELNGSPILVAIDLPTLVSGQPDYAEAAFVAAATALGIAPGNLWAEAVDQGIFIYASLNWLRETYAGAACGATTFVAILDSGAPVNYPMDDYPCLSQSASALACKSQLVLCESQCHYQKVLLQEINSVRTGDRCWPKSQEIATLIQAAQVLAEVPDWDGAQKIVNRILQANHLTPCSCHEPAKKNLPSKAGACQSC